MDELRNAAIKAQWTEKAAMPSVRIPAEGQNSGVRFSVVPDFLLSGDPRERSRAPYNRIYAPVALALKYYEAASNQVQIYLQ